jgi:hypothetical protein
MQPKQSAPAASRLTTWRWRRSEQFNRTRQTGFLSDLRFHPCPRVRPGRTKGKTNADSQAYSLHHRVHIDVERGAVRSDNQYLTLLNKDGIVVKDSAGAIRDGHLICSKLDGGESFNAVAGEVSKAYPTLTQHQLGTMMGAAIGVYCPNDLAKIPHS